MYMQAGSGREASAEEHVVFGWHGKAYQLREEDSGVGTRRIAYVYKYYIIYV